jgi:hypothetical protein
MKTNKVITELKRIANKNGGLLQPETVVESARPASSPLHSRFEWDNTVAGQQYRIWQARQLIRVSVEIIIPSMEKPTDVFVSLSTDREKESGGYRIMVDVLTDKQMRQQMLADALAELEIFREKYSRLKELAAVFAAIKKVRKK